MPKVVTWYVKICGFVPLSLAVFKNQLRGMVSVKGS